MSELVPGQLVMHPETGRVGVIVDSVLGLSIRVYDGVSTGSIGYPGRIPLGWVPAVAIPADGERQWQPQWNPNAEEALSVTWRSRVVGPWEEATPWEAAE